MQSRTDQAFERLMQRVPGFEDDPPEAETVQQELELARIRKAMAKGQNEKKEQ